MEKNISIETCMQNAKKKTIKTISLFWFKFFSDSDLRDVQRIFCPLPLSVHFICVASSHHRCHGNHAHSHLLTARRKSEHPHSSETFRVPSNRIFPMLGITHGVMYPCPAFDTPFCPDSGRRVSIWIRSQESSDRTSIMNRESICLPHAVECVDRNPGSDRSTDRMLPSIPDRRRHSRHQRQLADFSDERNAHFGHFRFETGNDVTVQTAICRRSGFGDFRCAAIRIGTELELLHGSVDQFRRRRWATVPHLDERTTQGQSRSSSNSRSLPTMVEFRPESGQLLIDVLIQTSPTWTDLRPSSVQRHCVLGHSSMDGCYNSPGFHHWPSRQDCLLDRRSDGPRVWGSLRCGEHIGGDLHHPPHSSTHSRYLHLTNTGRRWQHAFKLRLHHGRQTIGTFN